MIIFHELVNETGDIAAGRALEIAKLLQSNRRVRVAANVRRIGRAFSGQRLTPGNSEKLGPLGPIEHGSAPECGQCDRNNNDKRQITLHGETSGEFSTQRMSRQVSKAKSAARNG